MLRVDREPQAEEVRWRIDDVSPASATLTRRGEPIFDFSNQPAFYFFADRPNPTRFYQVPILSPRAFPGRDDLRARERAKPKVVIRRSPELFDQFDGVTNDLRAQAVSAYLDDTYRFYRPPRRRALDAPSRRQATRARRLSGLIRLPDKKELVNAGLERMVFPAVGSVPGVGGAFWQSDLTMHNPLRHL